MEFTFNWKMKLLAIVISLLLILVLLSNILYGGIITQAKYQADCLRQGMAVDRNSEYKWLLNTCAINRGTSDKPNWVISKRDMGLDASDVSLDNVGN